MASITNRQKFKEIFGFTPRADAECIAPSKICYINNDVCTNAESECPFWNWWDKEYKACFQINEALDEE